MIFSSPFPPIPTFSAVISGHSLPGLARPLKYSEPRSLPICRPMAVEFSLPKCNQHFSCPVGRKESSTFSTRRRIKWVLFHARTPGWTFGNGMDARSLGGLRGLPNPSDSLVHSPRVHRKGPHSQRDRPVGFSLPPHESEAAVTGVVSMAPLFSLPERAEGANHLCLGQSA